MDDFGLRFRSQSMRCLGPRGLIVALACFAGVRISMAASASEKAPLSAKSPSQREVIAAWERWQSAVHSLTVKYRLETEGIKGGQPQHESREMIFCWSGNSFAEHGTIISSTGYSGGGFPNERPSRFFDDRVFFKCWSRHQAIQTTKLKADAQLDFDQEYLDALAWWPLPKNLQQKDSNNYCLPGALIDHEYEILSDRETVDGVSCVVMKRAIKGENTPHDTIWLDPDSDWSLRRRLFSIATLPGRQDSQMLIEARDYVRVANVAWLPKRVELQQQRRLLSSEEYAPIGRTFIRVSELAANIQVNPSTFKPPLSPGTIIEDDDANFKSIIPGGFELMDKSLESLKAHYKWKGRVAADLFGMSGLYLLPIVLLIACSIVRIFSPRQSVADKRLDSSPGTHHPATV